MINKQSFLASHAETLTQNVVGQALAFGILWAFGINIETSLKLQAVFLVVAYARGYAIRRMFESLR